MQIKLTKKQKEVVSKLKENPGAIIRKHRRMTNTVCYRLLDAQRNPLTNYRAGVIERLADKEYLTKDSEANFILPERAIAMCGEK